MVRCDFFLLHCDGRVMLWIFSKTHSLTIRMFQRKHWNLSFFLSFVLLPFFLSKVTFDIHHLSPKIHPVSKSKWLRRRCPHISEAPPHLILGNLFFFRKETHPKPIRRSCTDDFSGVWTSPPVFRFYGIILRWVRVSSIHGDVDLSNGKRGGKVN